jgi:acylglycerol lipase
MFKQLIDAASSRPLGVLVGVVGGLVGGVAGPYVLTLTKEEHSTKSKRHSPNAELQPQFFENSQGLWIYTNRWIVPSPKGCIFFVHGFGEHILRAEAVARLFNAAGYSVYGMDHQGHGQSDGDRAYFVAIEHLVNDFTQFVARERKELPPSLPCFLFGRSMGGLLALNIRHCSPLPWAGVVVSASLLEPDPDMATPFLVSAARFLSNVLPKAQLVPLDSDHFSHDERIAHRFLNDPLCFHGGCRARVGAEFLRFMEHTNTHVAPNVTWPIFMMHGDADKVCRLEGTKKFFDAIPVATDKTLKLYEGSYHELMNDSDHRNVVADVIAWLDDHTAKKST